MAAFWCCKEMKKRPRRSKSENTKFFCEIITHCREVKRAIYFMKEIVRESYKNKKLNFTVPKKAL